MQIKNNQGFLNYIYEYYRSLDLHEILLMFEGQVTHRIMKTLSNLVEEQLSKSGENEVVRRRVFHVMVESLQNISRHAETLEQEGLSCPGRGLIMIDNRKESCNITTGNVIDHYQMEELTEFLAKINHLDGESLDEMYMKQLGEGHLSSRGGAGLGFIDIRRKTGNPIEYHFITIDERTSFFIFVSKISK
ncbi:MAG: SiaB family protein kinase [Bacteroidales bacterium]|nr:SiaB family protein kinase [Bacteroidales bacterium]MBN2698699.1 SiaB family protein kinase [Bacteroidales bacterium]